MVCAKDEQTISTIASFNSPARHKLRPHMASIDIGIDQGFVFAQTFLKHSQQSIGAFPPGFPDLTACSCRPTPIIIHDLSKAKLFYDFELESETHIVGSIRILATKALGHPFVSIQGSWF